MLFHYPYYCISTELKEMIFIVTKFKNAKGNTYIQWLEIYIIYILNFYIAQVRFFKVMIQEGGVVE